MTKEEILDKFYKNGFNAIAASKYTKEEIQNFYDIAFEQDRICSKCGRERVFINAKQGYKEFHGCCSKSCFFENSIIDKEFIDNYLITITKNGIRTIISEFTKYLKITLEELYFIYYELDERPKCYCGNDLKFITFAQGYTKNCSKECSYKSEERNEKISLNMPKTKPKTSESLRNRSKEDLEKAKLKSKKTRLEKYGNENYNNINKSKETCLEKYGSPTYYTSENFKLKSKKTRLERYGNENYVNTSKIKETRKERKLQGKQYTIYPIANIENLNKDFIEANFVKNGFLLSEDFKNYFDCKETFMYKKLKELGVEYGTRSKSIQEGIISRLFDYNVKIKDNSIIFPEELGIYIKDLNLAIEYNSLSKDDSIKEIKSNLHKTELCEKAGIQLYNIFENEWVGVVKRNIWISKINGKQNKHTKIYARKCTIKEISNKESNEFLELNHLQGFCAASVRVGLFYNDELVSVMTFGKSRYKKDIEWELIRFASKINISIIGGASKMLKYFERNYNPKSLISYANRRWSKGDVYEKLGFEYKSCSTPNYFYFLQNNLKLYSRENFQKHKLKNLLKVFNDDLTESENMYNNGYRKIYDCGNKVYLKIYEENH